MTYNQFLPKTKAMNRKDRRSKGLATKQPASGRITGLLAEADHCLTKGIYDRAAGIYRQVLETAPANATALFNLALLCQQNEAYDEAEKHLRKMLKHHQDDTQALLALSFILMDKGDKASAIEIARKAEKENLAAPLLNKLGILHREAGSFDDARRCFSAALKIKPDYIDAHYSQRTLKTYTDSDPDFLTLQQLEKTQTAFNAEEKIRLEFTLAKAMTDQGNAEASFIHLALANKLKRATYKFDIASFEKHVDGIIGYFTPERIKSMSADDAPQSARPVFIVGMPRSGSTLVDQILSSHPAVASIGESKALPLCLPPPGTPLTPALLKNIGESYLARTDGRAGAAERLVDKMLFNNYLRAGIIALALPRSKIIWCTRDPADIGLSIWQILFTESLPWAYDLGEIGRYFRAHERLMQYWQKMFPERIFEANYERLVENQETETRRLLNFCSLDFNPQCLRFHETERQIKTASAGQVRQPVYNSSVGKWRKYAGYLTPLLESLKEPAA